MKISKLLLAAVAASAFATPSFAAHFYGYAEATQLRDEDEGLVLFANPIVFDFTLGEGASTWENVLQLGTDERAIETCWPWNTCDTTPFDIEVTFHFWSPDVNSGETISGTTRGRVLWQDGIVDWDNSPKTFTFGNGGEFTLKLKDASFAVPGSVNVEGQFHLISESLPVPEASTWAMMVAGFGALGMAMRRRRSTKVSFA